MKRWKEREIEIIINGFTVGVCPWPLEVASLFLFIKPTTVKNNAQIVRLYRHTKMNQDNKIALFNWLCLRKEKDLKTSIAI